MSISHLEWSKGARKIDMVKYYHVQKWQIIFNLEQLLIFNQLLLTLSIIVKEGPYQL